MNLSYRERLNLQISTFGQDVVVSDGQFLWTADAQQLDTELEKTSLESDDDQGCSGEIYAYAALCSRVQYLAEGKFHTACNFWNRAYKEHRKRWPNGGPELERAIFEGLDLGSTLREAAQWRAYQEKKRLAGKSGA